MKKANGEKVSQTESVVIIMDQRLLCNKNLRYAFLTYERVKLKLRLILCDKHN